MANTTKAQSVSAFCKRKRQDPKVIRRRLRSLGLKRPKDGWKITPVIERKLIEA